MLRILAFLSFAGGMALLLVNASSQPAAAARDAAPAGVALVRGGSGAISELGGSIVLPVDALDVEGLGAVTVRVSYDPGILSATFCQRNAQGFPSGGFCNLQVDRDADGRYDAVYFNELAQDGASAPAGGALNLARVTWTLVGSPAPGSSATLTVSVTAFTNVFGETIPFFTEDGLVTVAEAHRVRLPFVMLQYPPPSLP